MAEASLWAWYPELCPNSGKSNPLKTTQHTAVTVLNDVLWSPSVIEDKTWFFFKNWNRCNVVITKRWCEWCPWMWLIDQGFRKWSIKGLTGKNIMSMFVDTRLFKSKVSIIRNQVLLALMYSLICESRSAHQGWCYYGVWPRPLCPSSLIMPLMTLRHFQPRCYQYAHGYRTEKAWFHYHQHPYLKEQREKLNLHKEGKEQGKIIRYILINHYHLMSIICCCFKKRSSAPV